MSKFGSNISKDRKLYGNCQVFSPDGHLMFRCNDKKANWYLHRGLASIINEEPLSIKLSFSPNGLGNHDKPFGLNEMHNKCVVCGTEEFLTRHHVVPICYRKFFPLNMKSHNFHDVLSLCMDCHDSYERKADVLKSELADRYEASLNGIYTKDIDLIKIIKKCNTLLRDTSSIPENRVNEMKKEVRKYLGRDYTNEDLIEICSSQTMNVEKTHGQIVIEKTDDIQEFIEMWRKHFIENNDCKFLPDNWNIKNVILINDTKR